MNFLDFVSSLHKSTGQSFPRELFSIPATESNHQQSAHFAEFSVNHEDALSGRAAVEQLQELESNVQQSLEALDKSHDELELLKSEYEKLCCQTTTLYTDMLGSLESC
jgi:hypothetical protein